MKTKLLLSFVLAANLLLSQNNKEFDNLPSGIYFKDGNQVTALDPTLVNFSKKGNPVAQAYGFKAKSIGELTGKEANYLVKSDVKFYFKFKPEEKELNSSNANATNKVGEENYMNILMSGANSKAISPNEFKLVRFTIKKGKRTYFAGKYLDVLGLNINYSLKSEEVFDFKYKKIGENLFEVYFPMGIIPGEYCFVYLDNSTSNLDDYLITNNNTKVFDFSVK
jgi:hypothetical protein